MKKFFENCKTAEDLKAMYKTLVKKLHPDNGGNAADFAAMRNEFADMFDRLKNTHKNSKGETYTRTGEYETHETAKEFMDIIDKFINMPGIVIEIIGSWLWISGDTRNHTAELKAAGLHFSGQKQAWYYHKEPYAKKTKTRYSMDTLREMWGSETIRNNSGQRENDETETRKAINK